MNKEWMIIEAARLLFQQTEIYKKANKARRHYESLKKLKTGKCEICKKEFYMTHFHHLNPELKSSESDGLYYGFEDIYWDKKIKITNPKTVLKYFLEHYIEYIQKYIDYYSVNREDLMELCSTCHNKQHKKYPKGWL